MPQPTAHAAAGARPAPFRRVHRLWVPLPLALLLTATGVDVAAALTGWAAGIGIGYHLTLAGLIAALPAALLGAADAVRWRRTAGVVPARLGRHLAAVGAALACYALGWFLRAHPEIPPDPPVLALGVAGALLLILAARMGSRVTFRGR